ncbi:MAG: hypothetical protein AAF563_12310 [Pseudomonadota bacterium]
MATQTISGDLTDEVAALAATTGGSTSKGITVIIDDAKVLNAHEASVLLSRLARRIREIGTWPITS